MVSSGKDAQQMICKYDWYALHCRYERYLGYNSIGDSTDIIRITQKLCSDTLLKRIISRSNIPNLDITDFVLCGGLNTESWNEYCKNTARNKRKLVDTKGNP